MYRRLNLSDHGILRSHHTNVNQPHATLSVCPLMELTFSPCMDLHMCMYINRPPPHGIPVPNSQLMNN